ncbi:MAG: Fic family protein [Anaerolineae bacterium]|nr:Fic family protein [Anaerolineae bacterium]
MDWPTSLAPGPGALRPGSRNAKQAGVLKAIIAHVYIAWIRPFADCNGRTARLLESRLLCQAELPQSAANLLSPHYYCTRPAYYRRL